jgi:predicted phage baseplate assembly protein
MTAGTSAADVTRALTDCGCCEGLAVRTPGLIENRPGLTAIAYRIGTYASFKQTMLARLSGPDRPALSALRTRDADDFTVALLDAWAIAGDVLTFYQERVANEAYLRTATERFSLLHLARLIGYELRPGVAASTYLAFTMDASKGAPRRSAIGASSKVQSVAEPGERAQLFETTEAIETRVEWNAMRPRMTQPQPITTTMGSVVLRGIVTTVRVGDSVGLVDGANRAVHTVLRVVQDIEPPATDARLVPDAEAHTTTLELVTAPAPPPAFTRPMRPAGAVGAGSGALSRAVVTDEVLAYNWNADDLLALAASRGWSVDDLTVGVDREASAQPAQPGKTAVVLRQRAAIFGHNAPQHNAIPASLRLGEKHRNKDGTEVSVNPPYATSWEQKTLAADDGGTTKQIDLDTVYPGIVQGSRLALVGPSARQVYEVTATGDTTRRDYGLVVKVTRLTLDNNQAFGQFQVRTTTVLAASEPLDLAPLPIEDPVQNNWVMLDRLYLGLRRGQPVVVSGEREDLRGVSASEVMLLADVSVEGGFTTLTFERSLANRYVRRTVTVNANAARATHGDSVQEVLGGGDAGQPFQRFTLRQPPLTHVSAATPSGAESTLEVRVNDVRWHEVPSLLDRSPTDRVYVTRDTGDGRTEVMFGDGDMGTRLPTGLENVRARYRKGIGLEGLVKAGQLSQLLTRPLGIKGVTNPLPATGADDPEAESAARRNAPLTILTLDRIVSLRDYEDFGRSYAGIAKALATWSWVGEARGVLVTVAGPNGAEIAPQGAPYDNLLRSMQLTGDPVIPLRVTSYRRVTFRLSAGVHVDADYLAERVLADVEARLRARFAFDAREFGQPVALSEVVAAMHDAPGVLALDVDALHRADQPVALSTLLIAAMPEPGERGVSLGAELLTLDPRSLDLRVLT